MQPFAPLARQTRWTARNIAYNLNYIPADKLAWKPAETAKSALEIVAHVAGALSGMQPALAGGDYAPQQPETPADREAARQLLLERAESYAAALEAVTPEQVGEVRELPFGTLPLAQVARMPVIDLVHHHGQIAYLQTLLGDEENHFDMEAFSQL